MEDDKVKVLYRYTLMQFQKPTIVLFELNVIKETEKGYWIGSTVHEVGKKRFILKEGKKAYARTTKKQALIDYYHRANTRLLILSNQMEDISYVLNKLLIYIKEEYGNIDNIMTTDKEPKEEI